MYEITVNNSQTFKVEKKKSAGDAKVEQLLLDDNSVEWSCRPLPDGSFSILFQKKVYRGELLEFRREEKLLRLLINGQEQVVQIKEPIDRLLKSMGLNSKTVHKVNQITSPMPGMVLKILVKTGQKLRKGDAVLVLEAMKMENVFKAPEDAIVKEISVKEKMIVEKGQVLVVLE